ncbi:hypothetical protein SRHO_G00180200 [Serrasalmus rhombeus]
MQADLLISLRMSLTVSLLVLLFISGVVAQDGWGVDYKDQSICALKWSTVTMRCTYTYPSGHVVQKAFWTKQSGRGSETPDLTDDPKYRGRLQYLGDQQHNCTLRLSDVKKQDQRRYYFRFTTNQPGGQYQGADGVDLSVTDLQVEVPERVIEGDEVTLTCKTSCSLTVRPTFTWYRNWDPLSSRTDQLHLQPVSREDAGRYHCAVWSQSLYSPVVTLNVRYGPKSVSVSISPSAEIVEGRSVTLTCSSDGNPPVEYNWIKGASSVGKGETYTMKKISSVDSGEYKCRSSNEHGEKLSEALTLNVLYLQVEVPERVIEGDKVTLTCKTSFSLSDRPKFTWYRNGRYSSSSTDQLHLQPVSRENKDRYHCAVWSKNLYSPVVTLNVRYGPKSVSVSISPSGEIVEGSSVTLTCSSDANPPVEYNWIKGTSSVGKGETYTMKKISSVDSGEYKCRSSNEHGEKLSEALTLKVLYPPKNISVSISPSSETSEGSSVTLTCSSDANPPVQNYTWFKEGGSSPVGSGHSYTALQSGSYYWVWNSALYAVIGVTAGCGCLSVIIAVFCVRRKKKGNSADDANQTQENLYSNVAVRPATSDAAPDPDPSNQDDVPYASVGPRKPRNPRNAESSAGTASAFGADEEVQYASVQHRSDKVAQKTEVDAQYASVRFSRTGAANRAARSTLEDPSVIYCSVK